MKNLILIVAVLITTLTFSQVGFKGCPTGEERVEVLNSNLEREILRLVNIEREKENLIKLKWQNDLGYAARYHAKDMALDNYFDHDTYDRKNGSLRRACGTFDRIKKFNTSGVSIAENISAGRNTAEAIVKGWMNSPGHKKNILLPQARFLGVGYIKEDNSRWTHYCVQCFGY